jgi:lactoylglutathione lyase
MLHLGSVYLTVRDMERTVAFYTALLGMQPTARTADRWAQFDFDGKCIALYCPAYDDRRIAARDDLQGHYNEAYLRQHAEKQTRYGDGVVLNFWTEDLRAEYERVARLGIGPMSPEMLYVNISSPYYFFTVYDPDGNPIEITGAYNEE